MARFNYRATLIWNLIFITISTHAIVENSNFASIIFILISLLYPNKISIFKRVILFFIAFSSYYLGPVSIIIITFIIFLYTDQFKLGIKFLLAITSVYILMPFFDTVSNSAVFNISVSSLFFLFSPILIASILLIKKIWFKPLFYCFFSVFTIIIFLELSFKNNFIDISLFTESYFRTILIIVPCIIAAYFTTNAEDEKRINISIIYLFFIFLVGLFSPQLIPISKIDNILFDESHGNWETVNEKFEPSNFGRGVNYTYSELYEYSSQLVKKSYTLNSEDEKLPSVNSLIILKTPIKEFSNHFIEKINNWVEMGGRLMIIADHTNLFDTSENLNKLLKKFDLKISSDAVFDKNGMPNRPSTGKLGYLLGKIDAGIDEYPWQTGTTMEKIKIGSIGLATYGMSFKEEADYSRPNRFGTFNPDEKIPFLNSTGIVNSVYGKGSILIVLDSTPWSNFALFRYPYLNVFKTLIESQEHIMSLNIVGYLPLINVFLLILLILYRKKVFIYISTLSLGFLIGNASIIGFHTISEKNEKNFYDIGVSIGKSAYIEFLPQLVPFGFNNYSRILSSLTKYDHLVQAYTFKNYSNLGDFNNIILIEPNNVIELPNRDELYKDLRNGRNITILFSENSTTNKNIIEWINEIGLYITSNKVLAFSEGVIDEKNGILGRKTIVPLSINNYVVKTKSTSLLRTYISDDLFQSFEIRPSSFPRTSGLLNISFSADQFSDMAIGDIWEGKDPSSLGKLREKQFSSVISGLERESFPRNLFSADRLNNNKQFNNFIVLKDGNLFNSGTIKNIENSNLNIQVNPQVNLNFYVLDMKDRILNFIDENCQESRSKEKNIKCENRFLSPDLLEWIVYVKKSKETDKVNLIELIHEKTFSGTGSSWNVLFSE